MVTRIAHISDIHIERCDADVTPCLSAALKNENADLLVVTGDLVDNPWRLRQGKEWLQKLCDRCGIDAKRNLLVVPGNHDYRILGNFGFKPLTGRIFRRHFPGWDAGRVTFLPERGVTFFKIDSNPTTLGFARGRIWGRQLREIREALDSTPEAEHNQIERSTKIAILHHHPLPVPYEGEDMFLMLENAQEFIQFLAERRIDMVLHGHKHRAPHSLLALGTCGGRNRVIEFVGAGTAVAKGTDREARGHNFNLITIEDTGLRYVRQFFAQPGEEFREVRAEEFCEAAFESAYRRGLSCGHRYREVHWDLDIDEEGDGLNEIAYVGAAGTEAKPLEMIELPAYKVEFGHLSPVSLVTRGNKTSEGVSLATIGEDPRALGLAVRFKHSPTEKRPSNFCLRSYDLNGYVMNMEEYRRKQPGRKDGIDWAEKEIREPVDQFTFAVKFPAALKFTYPPRFEVVAAATGQVHEWLTEVLQPCFHYSDVLNTAFLSISRPVPNYRYRISWRYPETEGPPGQQNLAAKLKVKRFTAAFLQAAEGARSPEGPDERARALLEGANAALAEFAALLKRRIEEQTGAAEPLELQQLDLTLMVCDDRDEQQPPTLRMVAGHAMKSPTYRELTLEIGDGNAGRAYKKGTAQVYERRKVAGDPKRHAYVQIPGFPYHEVLCSLPLTSPAAPQLIFGILNVGTFSADQADALRSLNAPESMEWMSGVAHSLVLSRLLEIVRV